MTTSSGASRASRICSADGSPPAAERFVGEVRELHGYLGDWLTGRTAHTERGPVRLENALAEDFIVIHPDGVRDGKAAVVQNFASTYGGKSAGYALEITDIAVRLLGDRLGLVTYRESHRGRSGLSGFTGQ